MARGIPLLLYRNQATDELVESNRAGCLVPAGDVNALAAALIHLHTHREELVHFARQGLSAAAQNTLENWRRRRAALVSECFHDSSVTSLQKEIGCKSNLSF